MKNKELIKRYILFVLSLFFTAVGIAVTKKGELGVSPLSSFSNVLSYQFPGISFGTWLFLWNMLLLVLQILILRKNFRLIQLLQIPLSVIFGVFTDFGMFIASFIEPQVYIHRILLVVCGMVIIAFGISLAVVANVVMNSGEAFVKAISDTWKKNFGNVKVGFDVATVAVSILMSLAFFDFTIVGVREGTIISAVFTGFIVKFFNRILHAPLEKVLTR